MRKAIVRLTMAAIVAVTVASDVAVAQTTVEQRIQVTGDPAGPIQLPGMMGGQRQFKTGTGRIRGRVLASEGGGPIRRAQVRISGPDVAPKASLTDAEGRFEFRDLPAGRFTLQATKSGYVNVQYGQTRPFESGKPIELANKQSVDNADIGMPRGSVISGRVVDEYGDPVPDVSVTAMRQSWQGGRRRLVPSPGRIGQTNDLGQFRLYGLPPGEYYVSASLRSVGLELLDMQMMASGAIATTTSGPSVSEPSSGYASTYYPGTANVGEAQRISLGPGQESSSADFALVPVRLARVSGIVIGSDGKPLEGSSVSALPLNRELSGMLMQQTARSARDGSFTLTNVAPGDYTLQARSMQVFTSSQGDNVMVFRATAMAGGESESGSAPLSISGEDLTGVVLTTSKGGTATGHITFDGPRPASATSIRISAVPVEQTDGPVFGGGSTTKEDGSFEIKGVSGTRLIRANNAPPGWTLKSVKLNGTDITDTGADFKPGETTAGLEVELTNKSTAVNGGATAADGTVLKDYTVVIFAESPDYWRIPMTRWVTGTRPDQDGRFKVQNLPAGNYLAVAVDYVPQGEWGDPELLERLKSKAKRFSLGDGETQTLDLKLVNEY